jgi:hypothetical protein
MTLETDIAETSRRLSGYCRKHSADPMPNEKAACPKCKVSA